jgi:hypothetical protein
VVVDTERYIGFMTDYSHGNVLITTTATLIGPFPIGGGHADEPNGPGDLLQNNGPETIFLGSVAVVADPVAPFGGFALQPGEKLLLPASGSSQYNLYGITATGTSNLSYLGA